MAAAHAAGACRVLVLEDDVLLPFWLDWDALEATLPQDWCAGGLCGVIGDASLVLELIRRLTKKASKFHVLKGEGDAVRSWLGHCINAIIFMCGVWCVVPIAGRRLSCFTCIVTADLHPR